jgi:hypothetical protein
MIASGSWHPDMVSQLKGLKMELTFGSPIRAIKKEDIPYPPRPLTQDQIFDDETLRCVLYVAHVTKIPVHKIVSDALKHWYDVQGEMLINACGKGARQEKVVPFPKALVR